MSLFSRLTDLFGNATLPDGLRDTLASAGEALLRREYEAAERGALSVLERSRDLPRAYLVLGLARRGRGDLEVARAALREALRREPGDASAHFALAECELALGDSTRALREAEAARGAGGPPAETALL